MSSNSRLHFILISLSSPSVYMLQYDHRLLQPIRNWHYNTPSTLKKSCKSITCRIFHFYKFTSRLSYSANRRPFNLVHAPRVKSLFYCTSSITPEESGLPKLFSFIFNTEELFPVAPDGMSKG